MADSFRRWIGGDGINGGPDPKKLISIAAPAIPAIVERITALWTKNAIQFSLLANVLVLLFIVLSVAFNTPLTDDAQHAKESDAVRGFRMLWIVFWVFFLAVYLIRFGLGMVTDDAATRDGIVAQLSALGGNVFDNVLSNILTVVLFACYALLAGYVPLAGYVVGAVLVALVFSITEAIAAYFWKVDPETKIWAIMLWQILLGTMYCTVIALLVGRLESKVIKPPLLLIFALYFYAGLQPIGQAVTSFQVAMTYYQENNLLAFAKQATAWLQFIAAMLKVALFVLVYWLLDSGVLLFYFKWMSNQAGREGMEAQRAAFVRDVRIRDPRVHD